MKKEFKNKINNILVYIYCENPISKKYKLKKIKTYLTSIGLEKVKKIDIKQEIKGLESINYSGDEDIDFYIDNFIEVLQDKISNENLINLYNNISWMKIYVSEKIDNRWFVNDETLGIYYNDKNKLKFLKEIDPDVIYHELFHLSSNNPNIDDYAIGFRYATKEWDIGIGINEGYTELLVERYFGLNNPNVYNFEKNVVRKLDNIVGKEKMESFYFNYNLYGLINELKKIYSLEEIEKFIIAVDFISVYSENRFLGKAEKQIIIYKLKEIIGFLLKGYCIKLAKTSHDKTIKKEMLKEFLLLFDTNIFGESVDIYFDDIEYFNNIASQYLDTEIKLDVNNSQTKDIVL